MVQVKHDPKKEINEGMIRHIVLNILRSYNKQFRTKYGKMVICCDSKKYWRRDIFQYYKSHRKKDRDKSDFDWNMIFNTLNKIRDELKENFPHKVIEVESAEADDIIAVLSKEYSKSESCVIISSDKDFLQLQKYKNVTQYSPLLGSFLKADNPKVYVKEHIIRGDRGDGIPNFLSADDTFYKGERQKRINKKNLEFWVKSKPEDFCISDTMLRGYARNQALVDFDYIPQTVQENIIESFSNTKVNTKMNFLNYLIKNRLSNIMESADDF